jgi:hypothetical protein
MVNSEMNFLTNSFMNLEQLLSRKVFLIDPAFNDLEKRSAVIEIKSTIV